MVDHVPGSRAEALGPDPDLAVTHDQQDVDARAGGHHLALDPPPPGEGRRGASETSLRSGQQRLGLLGKEGAERLARWRAVVPEPGQVRAGDNLLDVGRGDVERLICASAGSRSRARSTHASHVFSEIHTSAHITPSEPTTAPPSTSPARPGRSELPGA